MNDSDIKMSLLDAVLQKLNMLAYKLGCLSVLWGDGRV